jgi:RNA polymerase sigma-70 factor (ECF subfamily)
LVVTVSQEQTAPLADNFPLAPTESGVGGNREGVVVPDAHSSTVSTGAAEFRALCTTAIPEVYQFVCRRCGDPDLAKDLTAEAMLAAALRVRDGEPGEVTTAWIKSVARNKLLEHWRRSEREQRRLRLLWGSREESDVSWPEDASPEQALNVLRQMPPIHQAVLTLRYLDDLSVPEVADELGRSLHATESLLARAKAAFRRAYVECCDE